MDYHCDIVNNVNFNAMFIVQALRSQGRVNALQKQRERNSRVGRSGYRGKRAQWEMEKNDPATHTPFHDIADPATRNYVLGRLKPNEEGKRILCPESALSLIQNIVKTDKEGGDALLLHLGKEHGGRSRGVSSTIGYSKRIKKEKGESSRAKKQRVGKNATNKPDDNLVLLDHDSDNDGDDKYVDDNNAGTDDDVDDGNVGDDDDDNNDGTDDDVDDVDDGKADDDDNDGNEDDVDDGNDGEDDDDDVSVDAAAGNDSVYEDNDGNDDDHDGNDDDDNNDGERETNEFGDNKKTKVDVNENVVSQTVMDEEVVDEDDEEAGQTKRDEEVEEDVDELIAFIDSELRSPRVVKEQIVLQKNPIRRRQSERIKRMKLSKTVYVKDGVGMSEDNPIIM